MRHAFFALIILGFFYAQAQEDFLVTVKKDTIYGQIDFRQSTFYDEIEVKSDDGKKTFKAYQIELAIRKGEIYKPVSYGNKKAIGKLIKEGRLSQYLFRSDGENAFINEVLVKSDNETLLVSNIGFKKRLIKFLSDCEELSSKISNKELGASDLDKIINIYNNDCEEEVKKIDIAKKDFSQITELADLLKDITGKLNAGEQIPSYMVEALERHSNTNVNLKIKELLEHVKNQ
ncbi:hypothetical protein [Ekhidna sp.]